MSNDFIPIRVHKIANLNNNLENKSESDRKKDNRKKRDEFLSILKERIESMEEVSIKLHAEDEENEK